MNRGTKPKEIPCSRAPCPSSPQWRLDERYEVSPRRADVDFQCFLCNVHETLFVLLLHVILGSSAARGFWRTAVWSGPYTMHKRGFDFDFGPQERKGATVLTGEIFRKWMSELWRCCEEGSGAVLWFLHFTASVLQGTYKKQYLGLGQR